MAFHAAPHPQDPQGPDDQVSVHDVYYDEWALHEEYQHKVAPISNFELDLDLSPGFSDKIIDMARYVQQKMERGRHRVILYGHPVYRGRICFDHNQEFPTVCPFRINPAQIPWWESKTTYLKTNDEMFAEANSAAQVHRKPLKKLLIDIQNTFEHCMKEVLNYTLDQDPNDISMIHAWISGSNEPMIKCMPNWLPIARPQMISRGARIRDPALKLAFTAGWQR